MSKRKTKFTESLKCDILNMDAHIVHMVFNFFFLLAQQQGINMGCWCGNLYISKKKIWNVCLNFWNWKILSQKCVEYFVLLTFCLLLLFYIYYLFINNLVRHLFIKADFVVITTTATVILIGNRNHFVIKKN